ncbi:hypothetical protein P3G22_08560, partial [Rhodopseudomonas sp. BAL398]|nr:hypothetical protein [Rhodopseudomonas sp. BAL398]
PPGGPPAPFARAAPPAPPPPARAPPPPGGARGGGAPPGGGGGGVAARVVSVPSLDLLLQQPDHLRHAIIGDAPVKVAIEAAVRFGWDAVIGPDGVFIGMTRFGASAPAKELYKYFGITAEAAAEAAAARLDGK